jgi:hypothetical protein
MSNNILEKDFSLLDEAINSINQIKKTSIVFQDRTGKWKVVLLNNRETFYNDFESLDIPNDDCFIIINDNFGNIKRKKVQLTYDDASFLAKVISNIKKNDFIVAEKNNLLEELNSLLKKQDLEKKDEKILPKTDLLPQELYCYFKSFIPFKIVVEQIMNNQKIDKLFLLIQIIDKKSLDVLEPLFRRNNFDILEINNMFDKNNFLSLKLNLKPKILSLVHDEIIQKGLNNCMSIVNPLGKGVLNNLINYDIVEIN